MKRSGYISLPKHSSSPSRSQSEGGRSKIFALMIPAALLLCAQPALAGGTSKTKSADEKSRTEVVNQLEDEIALDDSSQRESSSQKGPQDTSQQGQASPKTAQRSETQPNDKNKIQLPRAAESMDRASPRSKGNAPTRSTTDNQRKSREASKQQGGQSQTADRTFDVPGEVERERVPGPNELMETEESDALAVGGPTEVDFSVREKVVALDERIEGLKSDAQLARTYLKDSEPSATLRAARIEELKSQVSTIQEQVAAVEKDLKKLDAPRYSRVFERVSAQSEDLDDAIARLEGSDYRRTILEALRQMSTSLDSMDNQTNELI